MQGDSRLNVSLDKSQYCGIEKLTGEVQLVCVKPEEVLSLSIRVVASYHSKLTRSDIYSRSIPVYKRKRSFNWCIYSKEHPVFSERLVLDAGAHRWKFTVPLPEGSTPSAHDELSKHDYGIVKYDAIAVIGRKNGPFALGDLTSSAQFNYSPQHRIVDFDPRTRPELDIKFTDELRCNNYSEVGSDKRNLIETIITCPRDGLRQDVGNNLNVLLMSERSPIRVQRISLDLEACICMAQGATSQGSLGKFNLVDKKLDLTGAVVDLSSLLAGIELPRLVPSFQVYGYHRHFHRLHVAYTVYPTDSQTKKTKFKHEIVIRVLSPHVALYDSSRSEFNDNCRTEVSPPAYTRNDDAASEIPEKSELPHYYRL